MATLKPRPTVTGLLTPTKFAPSGFYLSLNLLTLKQRGLSLQCCLVNQITPQHLRLSLNAVKHSMEVSLTIKTPRTSRTNWTLSSSGSPSYCLIPYVPPKICTSTQSCMIEDRISSYGLPWPLRVISTLSTKPSRNFRSVSMLHQGLRRAYSTPL